MKTYSAKPVDVQRQWYLLDATQVSFGRLASQVAQLLLGKHKPQFTSHIDCGDFVIIINAENMVVTGNKLEDKLYYSHSGYPGGLRTASMKEKMAKDPTSALFHAIRGMIPTNKLRDARLARLKIYAGAEHKHAAQKPVIISTKDGKK